MTHEITTNKFKAVLMPINLIGGSGYFFVYNLLTNIKVGTIDGTDATFMPQDTDSYLSINDLREIIVLCSKAQDLCLEED